MNITLIGYGKMGRLIEKLALEAGHNICGVIDSKTAISEKSCRSADVMIDFSHPHVVVENLKKLAHFEKPIVVGTTGWYDRKDEVVEIVRKHDIGLFYDANFSVGVHLFLDIVSQAAGLIDSFHEYEIAGYEMHHSKKVDAPSGTAQSLLKVLEGSLKQRSIQDNQIETFFPSIRCGSIPGTHTLLFDSPCDTISLTHTARNREGFALGALQAAEWIMGRKGVFTMKNLLEERNSL